MPNATERYRAALARARRSGYEIGAKGTDAMRRRFVTALERLNSQASAAGKMTRAQAIQTRFELFQFLDGLEAHVGRQAEGMARLTIDEVSNIHAGALQGVFETEDTLFDAGAALARFQGVNAEAWAVFAARNGTAADFETLMRRHLSHAAEEVDAMIEGALSIGQSHQALTQDVGRLFISGDPEMQRFVDARSALRKGDLTPDEYAAYGFGLEFGTGLKTLMYDARRIAVSETNNALREANRLALTRSPVVDYVFWQLSGAHPEPDECDVLADANLYSVGPGAYPPEAMPVAPHPHCACTAGRVKTLSPAQWATGRPDRGAPKFQGLYHSMKRLGLDDLPGKARILAQARSAVRTGFVEAAGAIADAGSAAANAAAAAAKTAAEQAAAAAASAAKAARKVLADFTETAMVAAESVVQSQMSGRSFAAQLGSYGDKIADALGIQINTWTVKKMRLGVSASWNESLQITMNSPNFKRLKALPGLLQEAGIDLKTAVTMIEENRLDELRDLFGGATAGVRASDAAAIQRIRKASQKVQQLKFAVSDLSTLIHESYHGLSSQYGSAARDYFALGKALEEGLVEYSARSTITGLTGKSWREVAGAAYQTSGLQATLPGAYNNWVRSTVFIADTLGGDELIERIFKAGERTRRYGVIKDAFDVWVDAEIASVDASFGAFLKRSFDPNRLTFLIYAHPDRWESFRDAWRAGEHEIARTMIDKMNQLPYNPRRT